MLRLSFNTYTNRKILRTFLLIILGFCIIVYLLFQTRLLIAGPVISLNKDLPVQTNERVMDIKGLTENIVSITLNGRNIFTDESGLFHEQLVLENGYTIMELTVHDRYGREESITHPFVYIPVSNINL